MIVKARQRGGRLECFDAAEHSLVEVAKLLPQCAQVLRTHTTNIDKIKMLISLYKPVHIPTCASCILAYF